MCGVFSAYRATAAHVKHNHDIYGTANQSKKLFIQSERRTWSILLKLLQPKLVTLESLALSIFFLQSYNGTLITRGVN